MVFTGIGYEMMGKYQKNRAKQPSLLCCYIFFAIDSD